MKCIKCKTKYKLYMFDMYNLGLCSTCYNDSCDADQIEVDETVDDVTHKVTCPKCKAVYDYGICDSKCKTKGCDVYFFEMVDDKYIFAKWLKK